MATATRDTFFKAGVAGRDKGETTTAVARSIAEAEVAAREAKTARLKKLRLAKEAADEAAALAEPKPAKPARRRQAARVGG